MESDVGGGLFNVGVGEDSDDPRAGADDGAVVVGFEGELVFDATASPMARRASCWMYRSLQRWAGAHRYRSKRASARPMRTSSRARRRRAAGGCREREGVERRTWRRTCELNGA